MHFVTFNYDVSLERRLFLGLSNISLFSAEDISAFLWNQRVFHIYGSVRERADAAWSPIDGKLPDPSVNSFLTSVQMLDKIFLASQGIRTIDGEEKTKNAEIIHDASNAIEGAEVAFVLGFGFDHENSERIRLDALRPSSIRQRTVFFTNYGGHNRVAIAAGRTLINDWRAFVPPEAPLQLRDEFVGNRMVHYRYEMSVKKVYEALSQDFDLL